MKYFKQLTIVLILFIIVPFQSFACSAYKLCINGKVYVAKNFDWYAGEGFVIKNNRNTEKYSYQTYEGIPAHWTSKYGSITFNQIGKEFPYGGINEKGLVVEQLWLSNTRYSNGNENTARISELEWIQYQLDNFSTVEEVIANLENLIIDPIYSKIHYFITDKNGNSVVVEYVDGKLVTTENYKDIQVITNSIKQVSDDYYVKMESQMDRIKPEYRGSLSRFCLVKNEVSKNTENSNFKQKDLFKILKSVSENRDKYKTQWTITYNLTDLIIEFNTLDNKHIKTINLSEMNFDKDSPILYIDIKANESKKGKEMFENYNLQLNEKLVQATEKQTGLKFQTDQLNKHQINPNVQVKDTFFINNYFDLEILFKTELQKGNIKYYASNSEVNFKRRIPSGGGEFKVKENEHTEIIYSLPKGEYAIGSFHDINDNGRLDFNWIHFPKEPFSFSNNTKGFLWMTPKFKKAKFGLNKNKKVEMNIK